MRGRIEVMLTAAAVGLVIWFFHWTVAANRGFEDWGDSDYYRLLVRGWQKGQLAMDKEPKPELLALADPYDPAQNSAHRLGDVSYFRGRYYLYFGAAPALTLMLPFNLITGREMTTGVAVFWFCTVAFIVASGVWLALRRRYFPESGTVMAPLGVLGLVFVTHLLALAQRPSFWELPIAAGLAFSLLALAAVYRAIHGRRPLRSMIAAGLCLGLAIASRPTCLFAAPMLVAPIWSAWNRRAHAGAPSWWRMVLAAALPLGACGLAVMAHNYARFENPFEFGQHYQLSGAYEGKWLHFSPRFVGHNIAVYFFQPVKWTWTFPFAAAQSLEIDLPGYFGTEEVCGLAVTFVFTWFVLGVPLMWRGRSRERSLALTATMGAIAGYVVPVAGLLLSYFSTTARYQADFAVVFGLLALCGMLGIERAAQRVRHGIGGVRSLAVVCTAVTVIMGALVSLDYHGRALSRTNPQRWAKFEETAQSVLGRVGQWLGQFDGPRVVKVRFQPRAPGTIETFWRATDPRAEERIVIEHTGDHLLRFGYMRASVPAVWGRALKWESDHTHTVEVQLPSLYHAPRGWLRGLRRGIEFRERSGVAVWFSGGRALDVIVDPWPADISSGGEIGRDFSGEVRRIRTRLFRNNEVRDDDGFAGAERGGALRLRIVLPDQLDSRGEPLFAAGAHYGSDIVFVRPADRGFKLVFEHYGSPQVESAVLPLERRDRRVDLVLPSCRRGQEEFGAYVTGDVIVRIDGTEVLRTRQACFGFAPGSEMIGRNPFGTTCGPVFRGWVLDATWVDEK
jgi:hypothetical protein